MKYFRWASLGISSLAAVILVACTDKITKPPVQLAANDRYDCPQHDKFRIPHGENADTLVDSLSVPGPITLIPEFHDCQRLIDTTGLAYGSLVGVWSSYNLPALTAALGFTTTETTVTFAAAPPPPTVQASAEVVAFDGDYEPLGIKRGFSCLYLLVDGSPKKLKAFMVYKGMDEAKCGDVYSAGPDVRELEVAIDKHPFRLIGKYDESDYPAAARWEWDPVTNTHLIGLKCKDTWCTVGRAGSTALPAYTYTSVDKKKDRIWRVKGWYDEQRMAIHLGGGQLGPGIPSAVAVPDKKLGEFTKADFATFQHVADVRFLPASAAYLAKSGYDAADAPDHMNEVSLCMNNPVTCFKDDPSAAITCPQSPDLDPGTFWFARLKTQKVGAPAKYKCVKYHSHEGTPYDPPGTVRWRWVKTDEELWTRCGAGCCQVSDM